MNLRGRMHRRFGCIRVYLSYFPTLRSSEKGIVTLIASLHIACDDTFIVTAAIAVYTLGLADFSYNSLLLDSVRGRSNLPVIHASTIFLESNPVNVRSRLEANT